VGEVNFTRSDFVQARQQRDRSIARVTRRWLER